MKTRTQHRLTLMTLIGLTAGAMSACGCDIAPRLEDDIQPPKPERPTIAIMDCTESCAPLVDLAPLSGTRALEIRISEVPVPERVQTQIFLDDVLQAEGRGSLAWSLDTTALIDKVYTLKIRATDIDRTEFEFVLFTADNCLATAEDPVGDGRDTNCDGVDGLDRDHDGELSVDSGGLDCDDRNPLIQVCSAEPGDPIEVNFDVPATRITGVFVGEDFDAGQDPDGEGADNTFGELFALLFTLIDLDMNDLIEDSIDSGQLLQGTTWRFDNDRLGAELGFYKLAEDDAGALFARTSSFADGSLSPRSRFDINVTRAGDFDGLADHFTVPFPFGGANVDVLMREVRIEGTFEETEDGIRLVSAAISGAVPADAIARAINGYLKAPQCDCNGIDGDVYIDLSGDPGPDLCPETDANNTCTPDDEQLCTGLATACVLLRPVIKNKLDVDLDGDGLGDAMSAYLLVEGVPARIEGVVED